MEILNQLLCKLGVYRTYNKLVLFNLPDLDEYLADQLLNRICLEFEKTNILHLEFIGGVLSQNTISFLEELDWMILNNYKLRFTKMHVDEPVRILYLSNAVSIHFVDTPVDDITIAPNCKNLRELILTGRMYQKMPPVDKIAPPHVSEIYFNDASWTELTSDDVRRLIKFDNLRVLGLSHCNIVTIADGYFPALCRLEFYKSLPKMGDKMKAMIRLAGVKIIYHNCPNEMSSMYLNSNRITPNTRWIL